MRSFSVIVNGEEFEVLIEEKGAANKASDIKPVITEKIPLEAPPKPAPIPVEEKRVASSGAENEIVCPLPGTVINILRAAGEIVKSGDVIMVIEAMKMENEIVSPEDGKITNIHVKKGESVQTGDLLVTLQ